MDHGPAVSAALEAAERAARVDDYTSAEHHLREAVALQEAATGPVDPDLANTLNNLGVACERAGKLDDAEASYRRAFDIAQEAFPPDHPFVLRSAENLRDFCQALGRPIDRPSSQPGTAAGVPDPARRSPDPVADLVIRHDSPMATTPATARRRAPVARIVMATVAAAAITAGFWMFTHSRSPNISGDEARALGGEAPPTLAPALPAPATAPATVPDPGATTVAPVPDVAPVPSPAAPVMSASILRADVCRNFSPRAGVTVEWRCDIVHDATASGSLAFYTRVRSMRPTTIEHRWYRGDALVQRVSLRVGANPSAGYRTFSRHTVGPGSWRVEVRDAAGARLAETRFVVDAR